MTPAPTPPLSSSQKILRNLSSSDLARLEAISKSMSFEANEYICRSNAKSPYVYRIDSGYALTERISSNGKRHVMAFLNEGSFVGFFDWLSFDMSLKSLQKTTVTAYSRAAFFALCDEIPTLKANMDTVGKNILSGALDYMYVLSQKTADERLCFFLQQVALRENHTLDKEFSLPCSREDIADHLGLSKETISRAMTRLRTNRIIRQETPNSLRIIDPKLMVQLSG